MSKNAIGSLVVPIDAGTNSNVPPGPGIDKLVIMLVSRPVSICSRLNGLQKDAASGEVNSRFVGCFSSRVSLREARAMCAAAVTGRGRGPYRAHRRRIRCHCPPPRT